MTGTTDLLPTPLPRRAARHRSFPERRAPWPAVWTAAVWASLLVVVALWVRGGGVEQLADPVDGTTSIGRLTGLVASDLLLVQVMLMARVPVIERTFGQDRLARWHRCVGFGSFTLMVVHIVTITLGYAGLSPGQVWPQIVDLTLNYPAMLLAVAGSAALCMVVVLSLIHI